MRRIPVYLMMAVVALGMTLLLSTRASDRLGVTSVEGRLLVSPSQFADPSGTTDGEFMVARPARFVATTLYEMTGRNLDTMRNIQRLLLVLFWMFWLVLLWRLLPPSMVLVAGALTLTQLLVLIIFNLAVPNLALSFLGGVSLAALGWDLLVESGNLGRGLRWVLWVLTLLAGVVDPYLWVAALALLAASKIKDSGGEMPWPKMVSWMLLSILVPGLASLLLRSEWGLIEGLLFGSSQGDSLWGSVVKLATAWMHQQSVQGEASSAVEIFAFLGIGYGQPTLLARGLSGVESNWINPVTALWGLFLILQAPVRLVVSILRKHTVDRWAPNLWVVTLLVLAFVHLWTFGNPESAAGIAMVLFPILLLFGIKPLFGYISALDARITAPLPWLRPLSLAVLLLVGSAALDTSHGLRILGQAEGAMKGDSQRRLALAVETVIADAPETPIDYFGTGSLGCIDVHLSHSVNSRYVEFNEPLPLRTALYQRGEQTPRIVVLEVPAEKAGAPLESLCQTLFDEAKLEPILEKKGWTLESVLTIGSDGVPGFCLLTVK